MSSTPNKLSVVRPRWRRAVRSASLFFLFGTLWILLSDRLVETFTSDAHELSVIQTYKGWFFIIATSALVFWLVQRSVRREWEINRQLVASEADAQARFYELSHVFRLSPIGLFVMDKSLRYVRVNDTLAEINGCSALDHIGKSLEEVVPDLAVSLRALWQPVLENGIPLMDMEVTGTTAISSRGERTWLCSFIPMKDDGGEIIGLIGAVADITERKAAERALRVSDTILEYLPDAAIIVDIDEGGTQIRGWHGQATAMFGYTREEAIGKSPSLLRHPDTPQTFVDDYYQQLVEHGSYHGEMLCLHKNGNAVPTMVASRMIEETGGRRSQLVTVIKDLTEVQRAALERRQLEAQIQQAQKMESLGMLAGGIAHDFNNLLLGILGNADLALMDMPMSAAPRRHVDAIVGSAQRAADLCNQLLAYSGKGRFVIQSVNVTEVVREMSHLLEISISKKARLSFQCKDDIPAVEADVTQLRQVVMNLLTNASDAIGEPGGAITVRTGAQECDRDYLKTAYVRDKLPEGTYVFLEVSDSGIGMDKETQARIFDPFFTTKDRGHGLGLAAVLGIIRGHGGTVRVYSERGKGTTIKVLLPCSPHAAESLTEAAAPPRLANRTGKVLVADDERAVRDLTQSILERVGFTVVTAEDGQEALEIFDAEEGAFALVLLDMTMPRLGGEETFREIRKRSATVPVILSSGYDEQDVTSHWAGRGLSGFIQKPYRAQALLDLIYTTLDREDKTVP